MERLVDGIVVAFIAFFLGLFGEEFIGPRPRFTLALWRRKFGRIFHDDPINARLSLRLDLAAKTTENDARQLVARALQRANVEASLDGDAFRGTLQQARTRIDFRLQPILAEEDSDESDAEVTEERVDAFTLAFEVQLLYRRFNDIINDLSAVSEIFTATLAREGIFVDPSSKTFAVDISALPELRGFFAILRTASFTANVANGAARLRYQERHLQVEGTLDSATFSILRDAILFGV